MKLSLFQVHSPSVDVRSIPLIDEKITTQILFGEQFKVLKEKGNWIYGFTTTDSYYGWLEKKNIGLVSDYTHIVCNIRSSVLSKPNVKSNLMSYLPLRSRIKVISIKNNWAKIKFSYKNLIKYGYVSCFHILGKNESFKNWITIAEKMVGIPYRWGGRDCFGIDCSALVQHLFAFSGISLPRDTSDQLLFFKTHPNYDLRKSLENKEFLKKGDIIYWLGHVGIIINEKKIIHASGFHSEVVIEDFSDVLKRIKYKPTFIILKGS